MKIFSVGTKNRETLLRNVLNKVLQPEQGVATVLQ